MKGQVFPMKLEINIDSTSLGSSDCIRKWYLTVVGSIKDGRSEGGYRTLTSAAAMYGVAVHKFVDTMYKTNGDGKLANDEMLKTFNLPKLPAPVKQPHLDNPRHLSTTCWNLWNEKIVEDKLFELIQIQAECFWCKGSGKKFEVDGNIITSDCTHCNGTGTILGPATELTFRIKIYEDEFVIIYLNGTIDSVGKFHNGCFAIRDWKTTSASRQDEYMIQYEMSRQLRVYTLACKLLSKSDPTSTLGRIGATNMGSFIDAIFIRSMANDNEYLRSDVYQYSENDLNAFYSTLMEYCAKISKYVTSCNDPFKVPKEGLLNGACTKGYPRCQFWNICKNNEQVGRLLLGRDFKRKTYDPLNFNTIE